MDVEVYGADGCQEWYRRPTGMSEGRATQEQLPRGTDYGADGRKTENTVSRFLHFSITYSIEKWQHVRVLHADCCF